MTLIQRAALQPGGDNFRLAVQKLNQYFEGTAQAEYELDSAAREYLRTQFPAGVVENLSDRTWTANDTRHIEDCMMYYPIATRVAGNGENLAGVRRIFRNGPYSKLSSFRPAGWLSGGCLMRTLVRTTFCYGAWLPNPRGSGPSARGSSFRSAASSRSTPA